MTIFLGILASFFGLEVMVEKEESKRKHFVWCFAVSLAAMVLKSLL